MKKLLLIILFQFLFGCAQNLHVIKVDDVSPSQIDAKQNLFFEVGEIDTNIPDGTITEVRSAGLLCVPQGTFVIQSGQDGGLTANSELPKYITDELKKYNIKTTALNVGYVLRPIVTKQDINSCLPHVWDIEVQQGEVFISINWQLVRKDDNFILFNLTTEGFEELLEPVKNGGRILIESVWRENVRKLVTNEDFRLLITLDTTEKAPPQTQITSTNNIVDEKYNVLIINQQKSKTLSKNANWEDAVVTIEFKDGHGSGFAISENYILTNYHVVGSKKEVTLKFAEKNGFKQEATGTVIRKNAKRDVALIEIKGKLPKYLSISKIKPKSRDEVYTLGTPLDTKYAGTLNPGSITHPERELEGLTYIQSNAHIYPGNSGGPMVNSDGQVIAISVMGDSRAEGINFFIPIDSALEYLNLEIK